MSNDYEKYQRVCSGGSADPTPTRTREPEPDPREQRREDEPSYDRLDTDDDDSRYGTPPGDVEEGPSGPSFFEQAEGRVLAIHDGDTLDVIAGGRVQRLRLHGVDAPELEQAYGSEARKALEAAVRGRVLQVEVGDQEDKQGRKPARVLADGQDVGEGLVSRGAAWWNRTAAP